MALRVVAALPMYWKAMVVVLLLLIRVRITVSSDREAVDELELPQLSTEEEMELEAQVKLLNKPAIKSIETEDGDIFDCVDIHKQPAFDHPLLKNHTVQTSPESSIERPENASYIELLQLLSEPCPSGTVPIRRVRKEHLIWGRLFKPFLHENYSSSEQSTNSVPKFIYQRAMTRIPVKNTGARADINVYGLPGITNKQGSASLIAIHNWDGGLQAIQAGWTVLPALYGDGKTRLFTYWTINKFGNNGCFNILCAGFVQTDRSIPLGVVIKPLSELGGRQVTIHIEIYKEPKTQDWWLQFNGKALGYWPRTLFQSLADHSHEVKVGGIVTYTEDTVGPPMGNGHYERGGPKPCYIEHVQLVQGGEFNKVDNTQDYDMTNHNCYWVNEFWNSRMNFGGPAGCSH